MTRAFAPVIGDETMDYETRVDSVKKYISYLEEQRLKCSAEFDAMESEMPLFTPALAYLIEVCV